VTVRIPEGLLWWRDEVGGADWLDSLPALAEACAARWRLTLGEPFEPATVSLVLTVTRHDGSPAVLKINFPEEESRFEAEALAAWQGIGAVQLLERDDASRSLLVERCLPGTRLWDVHDESSATRVAAGVLRQLWRPIAAGAPYTRLRDAAERWAAELPVQWRTLGQPFERRLLDIAVAALRELGHSQGEQVICHQDLHGGNILLSQRGWLAIDPKPLAGEREFDAASLLRDRRWQVRTAGYRGIVQRRLDIVVDEAGLDRERTRLWGVVHALAWGVDEDKLEPDMVECARILAFEVR
jgi:streptomycin 6-kinase